MTDATESSNDDAMDYNTEDDPQASFLDQTGNNIVYGLNNAVSTYPIHSLQMGMQSKSLLLQDNYVSKDGLESSASDEGMYFIALGMLAE